MLDNLGRHLNAQYISSETHSAELPITARTVVSFKEPLPTLSRSCFSALAVDLVLDLVPFTVRTHLP